MEKNESLLKSALKTGAILLVIAGVIALILSVVNYATAPKIAENDASAQANAIRELFPEGTSEKTDYTDESVLAFYEIKKDGETVGYCAHVSCDGFADKITMMIGIDKGETQNTVRALKILSIQDTPGIGLKVAQESFLSTVSGAASSEDVDAITGATYSSKGVLNGIDAALNAAAAYVGQGGAAA